VRSISSRLSLDMWTTVVLLAVLSFFRTEKRMMDDNNNHNGSNISSTSNNILHIAVGSTNPVKVQAVELALQQCLTQASATGIVIPHLAIHGLNVESCVPNQPMGNQQTMEGAKNRAKNAYNEYMIQFHVRPHLAIAMEGGLEAIDNPLRPNSESNDAQQIESNMFCMAWMAVYGIRDSFLNGIFVVDPSLGTVSRTDNEPVFGIAKSGMFVLPQAIVEHINNGLELGEADDIVFSRSNSKHGASTVGKLTNDLINRATFYQHAIVLAMTPWFHPHLFPVGQ
jgi:inosine/xanthosine triphosphatase